MTEADFLTSTRTSYDAIAGAYAETFRDDLASPLHRTMLTTFAELVTKADAGPVADVGSGPGRGTAYLHGLGVPVFGIDLSPAMVELARQEFPGLRFDVGSMTALDLADESLGGLVAFFSTIHIPLAHLPDVFARFHRVLVPGGYLLVAFQAGEETVHYDEGFGHPVSLDFHRRPPERIAELLGEAGFTARAQLRTEPEGAELSPYAYLLFRRPAP